MNIGMSKLQRIVHAMCDSNIKTEYGTGPTYKKFIVYVRNFLKPFMDMKFDEEEYYRDVYEEIWNNQRTCQQLPRGHSKTEMVGIWLTIYIADYQPFNPYFLKYRGKKKQMTQQTLLAGAQADLDAWTDRIKDFFYKSPPLRRLKPTGVSRDKVSPKWNNREMLLANGHCLHLRTVRGKIRGLHVDRVCADDLITESSTLTDQQTIDVWDGAVDGTTTTKEAMVNVTGTPLRFTDIQFHLKNKPDGYKFTARPAIIDEENKIVLSPKRRDYDALMRTKARIGSTKFSCEYMLNPIDDSVSLIKREHMSKCLDKYFEGLWLKPIITKVGSEYKCTFEKLNNIQFKRQQWDDVIITADFAFSDRITADHSVFSYYARKDRKWYRLGYIRNKSGTAWSSMTQFAIIKALQVYLGASMCGIEENSIKGVLKDVRDMNIPMRLFWMGGQDKAPAFKPDREYSDKRHTIGKIASIERLDATYDNQMMVIAYKTKLDINKADLQIEESISWALEEGKLVEIGRHPDIPITDILCNEMIQMPAHRIEMAVIGAEAGESDFEVKRTMIESKGIHGEEQ